MCILFFISYVLNKIFKATDIKYNYLVLAESFMLDSVCVVLPAKWKLLRWLMRNAWKYDHVSITREDIFCVHTGID